MSGLQIFENPEFGSIRTVEIDGEPWLVGKDVAEALGYQNPQRAIREHVDDEDKGVTEMVTPGGKQQLPIINESGLYSLILSSKLPDAKKFKRWVTSEVLPSIRKNGGYLPPAMTQTLADLTAAVQLLTERLDAMAEREAAPPPASPLSLPESAAIGERGFGPMARKRWMRTVSEKLDLLSTKLRQPNSVILSQIYKILEKDWNISLADERSKVLEEQNLFACSILMAISYNEDLRDGFQKIIDFNLAPENRGW